MKKLSKELLLDIIEALAVDMSHTTHRQLPDMSQLSMTE